MLATLILLQAEGTASDTYKDELLLEFTHTDNLLWETDITGFSNTLYFDAVICDGSVPYSLAPLSQKASSFNFGAGCADFGFPVDDKEFMVTFGTTIYCEETIGFSFDFGYGKYDHSDMSEIDVGVGIAMNNFPNLFALDFMYYGMDDAGTKYTSFHVVPSAMNYNADSNLAFALDLPIVISDDLGNSFGLETTVTVYVTQRLGLNFGADVTFPEDADTVFNLSGGFLLADPTASLFFDFSIELDTYYWEFAMGAGFKF